VRCLNYGHTILISISEPESSDISQYSLLIVNALATASFLSSCEPRRPPISVVLFDSALEKLKLPILRRPSFSHEDGVNGRDPETGPECVAAIVEKYFDWIGFVDDLSSTLSNPHSLPSYVEYSERRRLVLMKNRPTSEDQPRVVNWAEIKRSYGGSDSPTVSIFGWDNM